MKVWITKDKTPETTRELIGIFYGAKPDNYSVNGSGNFFWVAGPDGDCLFQDLVSEFGTDFGIDLQPGECREAEIEIKLIDAK